MGHEGDHRISGNAAQPAVAAACSAVRAALPLSGRSGALNHQLSRRELREAGEFIDAPSHCEVMLNQPSVRTPPSFPFRYSPSFLHASSNRVLAEKPQIIARQQSGA